MRTFFRRFFIVPFFWLFLWLYLPGTPWLLGTVLFYPLPLWLLGAPRLCFFPSNSTFNFLACDFAPPVCFGEVPFFPARFLRVFSCDGGRAAPGRTFFLRFIVAHFFSASNFVAFAKNFCFSFSLDILHLFSFFKFFFVRGCALPSQWRGIFLMFFLSSVSPLTVSASFP